MKKLHPNKSAYKKMKDNQQHSHVLKTYKALVKAHHTNIQSKSHHNKTQSHNKFRSHHKSLVTVPVVVDFIINSQFQLNTEQAFLHVFHIPLNKKTVPNKQDRKFFNQLYQISQTNLVQLLHQVALNDPKSHQATKLISEIHNIITTTQNPDQPQKDITLTITTANLEQNSNENNASPNSNHNEINLNKRTPLLVVGE